MSRHILNAEARRDSRAQDTKGLLLSVREGCTNALWNCVIDNEDAMNELFCNQFLDMELPPVMTEYYQELVQLCKSAARN